ncbi:MAG: DUF2293 domain-containing protein [Planctomycetes bacterium]|nr:DUF2293 domain-containing protein [Planctomycetota bacterium]
MEESGLKERVIHAAEAVLDHEGSVSALHVLMQMGWLHYVHFQDWQRQLPFYDCLERSMQSTPERRARALEFFEEWARARGLECVTAQYWPKARHPGAELQITLNNDPALEALYRKVYLKPGLAARKAEKIKEQASKPPELLVFVAFQEQECSECREKMDAGNLVFVEGRNPLCLRCADLDHLVFLPSGDATLTRRAKKHSQLWAVVLQFNRRRRVQERQGLLVTAEGLAKAEAECLSDEEQRVARRQREAERREALDEQLVAAMTATIRQMYPGCPEATALQIAEHTCVRGSGRVGRSAAGRELDPMAIDLAVRAHIRHVHTNYDTLLFTMGDRGLARSTVASRVEAIVRKWQGG